MIERRMLKNLTCVAVICLLSTACIGPRHPTLAPAVPAGCRVAETGAPGDIRWLEPADERNRTRLASWCAGVGPAVFLPIPPETALAREEIPAHPATPPGLDEITFVSWNVRVGTGDVAALVRDLQAGRLTPGRSVRHAVLLLQETIRMGNVPGMSRGASGAGWTGRDALTHNEVVELGRLFQMSVLYIPSMRNGKNAEDHPPADRGNAILSTLPLSNPIAIELPGVRQRRVAVMASLAVRAGKEEIPVSVSAAHLDATSAPRRLWLAGAPEIRAIQARSLIAAFPQGALVLGADLNTWMGVREPAARDLFRFFETTPAPSRTPTFKRGPLLPGFLLDYMFLRPPVGWQARYERVSRRYGSDHYPLVGWFENPKFQ